MFLGNGIFIRGIVIFWVMVFILEGWYCLRVLVSISRV